MNSFFFSCVVEADEIINLSVITVSMNNFGGTLTEKVWPIQSHNEIRGQES